MTTEQPVEFKDVGGKYPAPGLVAVAITTRRPQLIDTQINMIRSGQLLSAEHQITLLRLIQDTLRPVEPTVRQKDITALADEISKASERLQDEVCKAAEQLQDLAARVGEISE